MVASFRTNTRFRAVVLQGLALGVTAAILWWLGRNTVMTLQQHGISLGFGFLQQPANFQIGDTWWLNFSPENSFGRAILVGLVNTAQVSVIGCVLAVFLGFVLGVLRLSHNPALSGLMRAFVELIRNTPLLLLLLLLAATLHGLPSAENALEPVRGLFISDRGLVLPYISFTPITLWLGAALLASLVGRRWLGRAGWSVVIALAVALVFALVIRHPSLRMPRLAGFNFTGGITLSPEFAALLIGLVLHHSAHISEVVRGAILAVPSGQRDAALALGFSRAQTMLFVTIPQALRAMVPLLATNCVSLIKNSSLAVAIGLPDVVSILNTTGNQTGHSIETMLIMVAVYLSLSLLVAAALNRYNASLLKSGVQIT
jgi:general L-amino acid transport system permease protein